MATSALLEGERTGGFWRLPRELRRRIEKIEDPVLIYLPGGRIAAVNLAAARFLGQPVVGLNMGDLVERYKARNANGEPPTIGDLPYARALRGEVVALGERLEFVRNDGTHSRIMVTSEPIVMDGTVVAALSVWRDFDEYLKGLADREPAR